MLILFWNPLSITYLVETVLVSLLAGYFLVKLFASGDTPQSKRTAVLLFMTFSTATLGVFLQLLSVLLHPHDAMFALPWVSPAGAVAMSSFVLFAFYFQRPARANKLSEIALAIVLLVLIGMEVFIATQRHFLLLSGVVEFRETWINVPFSIGFLAAPIFFMKNLNHVLAIANIGDLPKSSVSTVGAILWPSTKLDRNAAALRAFFYVSIMPTSMGATLLLRSYGVIDWSTAVLVSCWIFLLTLASFALAYLNYVPERSSFRTKLVGITLTSVLLILSGVSWLVGDVYVDEYQSAHKLVEESAFRIEPGQDGSYKITRADYHFEAELGQKVTNSQSPIELPFDFHFYDQTYRSMYAHMGGMIGFDHLPRWRDVQHRFGVQAAIFLIAAELSASSNHSDAEGTISVERGVFVKIETERVVVTWNRLIPKSERDGEYTFQAVLYPDGAIEFAYADLPDRFSPDIFRPLSVPLLTGIVPASANRKIVPIHFSSSLPLAGTPGDGLLEFRQIEFLNYLDRIYAPVAYFILVSSLMVLLVFPLFFRVNLNLPLKQLIFGVQQILDGKLDTSIRVSYRDEVGFLATSFNKMAKAQSELIHALEGKVIKQSAEATEYAAENARLEERNHLFRELHDAVSQTLFAANLIADTLPELWEKDPEHAQIASQEIRQLNKEALAEMRQLLLELRPEKISAHPFRKLLQDVVTDIKSKYSISVLLQTEGDIALPVEVQLTFYRIAQECLTNAVKHAEANEVKVYFDSVGTQAMLSFRDDGVGFARDEVTLGHLGLQIMEERMQMIGGSIEIDSEIGRGTSVTAIWFNHDGEKTRNIETRDGSLE